LFTFVFFRVENLNPIDIRTQQLIGYHQFDLQSIFFWVYINSIWQSYELNPMIVIVSRRAHESFCSCTYGRSTILFCAIIDGAYHIMCMVNISSTFQCIYMDHKVHFDPKSLGICSMDFLFLCFCCFVCVLFCFNIWELIGCTL